MQENGKESFVQGKRAGSGDLPSWTKNVDESSAAELFLSGMRRVGRCLTNFIFAGGSVPPHVRRALCLLD